MKKENRFPLELDLEGARKIIDVACNDWKDKLSKKWCSLMNPDEVAIFINKSFYKEMRADCNNEQHKVLDEVFGKDEKSVRDVLKRTIKNYDCLGDTLDELLETFDIKFKK